MLFISLIPYLWTTNHQKLLYYFFSGAIAAIGHTAAHVPQLIHFVGSITHLPSGESDIAIAGQTPIHVWHPIHFVGSIL